MTHLGVVVLAAARGRLPPMPSDTRNVPLDRASERLRSHAPGDSHHARSSQRRHRRALACRGPRFAVPSAGVDRDEPIISGRARIAATQRFPVIGCDDHRYPFENHYSWRYAPSECETGGSLGTLEGVSGVHWRGWKRGRATGKGSLIDGLGFGYPASLTAYGLYRTHDLVGTGKFGSWYRRMRATPAGAVRGGALRGPVNVTINVIPQE